MDRGAGGRHARVLDRGPGRDWLRRRSPAQRATRGCRRRFPPGRTGVSSSGRRTPNDDKLKFMLRRGAGAPLETVLDPNTWAERRGAGVRRALARRRAGRVREGRRQHPRRGDPRARRRDGAAASRPAPRYEPRSLAWRPDASGFFYAAYPEPGEVPPGDEALWSAIYEHRLGSGAPARRIFGDDHVKEYWCSVKVSECGRFAVLYKWDFVHANVVYLLRLADDALVPVAPDMRSVNHVQVIGDSLLIHTDLDAPRGRLCVAPLTAPTEWRTLIPEERGHAADGRRRRRPALRRLLACGVASRAHPRRGRRLPSRPGAAGTRLGESQRGRRRHQRRQRAWSGDEVWVDFTSYVQPPSIYRYDYAADRLTPYHVPDVGLDASEYVTDQVWYESRDGTQVSMFIVHRKRPASRRAPARAFERLRRLQHLGGAALFGGQRRLAAAGRRARLRQHARRRRIRPRLARGSSQDAAAERLRRLHRRGALARLGGLHDARQARLARQQQRRSARRRHRHAGT